jgi:hypothetical protein
VFVCVFVCLFSLQLRHFLLSLFLSRFIWVWERKKTKKKKKKHLPSIRLDNRLSDLNKTIFKNNWKYWNTITQTTHSENINKRTNNIDELWKSNLLYRFCWEKEVIFDVESCKLY